MHALATVGGENGVTLYAVYLGSVMEAMVHVLPPSDVSISLLTTPEPLPIVFLKLGSASER